MPVKDSLIAATALIHDLVVVSQEYHPLGLIDTQDLTRFRIL